MHLKIIGCKFVSSVRQMTDIYLLTLLNYTLMKVQTVFNYEPKDFKTIKEFKTFLNSALYYSEEVFLTVDFSEVYNYSEIQNDTLRFLIEESKFYNKPLNVSQSF